MTTKADIRAWLERAKANDATHMLVVADTFDWQDYPVFIMVGENAKSIADQQVKDGNKFMECYNLSLDIESQLNEHRARNF